MEHDVMGYEHAHYAESPVNADDIGPKCQIQK